MGLQEQLSAALQGTAVSTDDEGMIEASSLINEVVEPKAETPVAETPTETPVAETIVADDIKPTKTWEQEFEERNGGKYKSWDEVDKLINAPKEDPFADDEIKTLNELKKQGVKFDNDFWELQTKDFANMKDPDKILLESMKRNKDYEGWSDKQLLLELDEKYRRKEWSDEGEEPNEIEELMSARLLRDSKKAKEDLINLKESMTVLKPQDPKIFEEQQKQLERQKEEWNKTVEDIAGSTLKLTTIVDDKTKESLEYEVTDTNRKAATEIMKQLGSDPLALFSQFKSADGKYDNKSIYDAVLRFITSNDAVKIAYQNAKAKGAEAEVKGLKNVDFKTDGTSTPTKKGGLAEALKQSIYGK